MNEAKGIEYNENENNKNKYEEKHAEEKELNLHPLSLNEESPLVKDIQFEIIEEMPIENNNFSSGNSEEDYEDTLYMESNELPPDINFKNEYKYEDNKAQLNSEKIDSTELTMIQECEEEGTITINQKLKEYQSDATKELQLKLTKQLEICKEEGIAEDVLTKITNILKDSNVHII